MSYKIYNRNNTSHETRGHLAGQMTCSLTRFGFVQLSKAAVERLGLKDGDGVVLMQDEDYDDFYFGRGDVHRGAFTLTQVGKSARLGFTCSGITDILAKEAIAPQDWRWMVLSLFVAPEGKLGIDLKHPRYPHRPAGDLTAAHAARKAKAQEAAEIITAAKKRGRPSKEEGR